MTKVAFSLESKTILEIIELFFPTDFTDFHGENDNRELRIIILIYTDHYKAKGLIYLCKSQKTITQL